MNNHDYSKNTSRLSTSRLPVRHTGLPPTAPGERIRVDEAHHLTPVSDTTRHRIADLLRHTRENSVFPSDHTDNTATTTED